MTREETITVLQKIKPIPCRGDSKSTTHLLQTLALDKAIKALDEVERYKKSIEVIRAEILSLKGDNFPNDFYVKIIDKHVKEVES